MYKGKIMNVYWGYENSGKSHIKFYSMYNGMTVLSSKHKNFYKQKYKISNRGVSPNNRLWIHYDLEKIMYYREDGKFLSIFTNDIDKFQKLTFKALDAYINPLSKEDGIDYDTMYAEIMKYHDTKTRVKYYDNILKSGKFFKYEDIKKYMSNEYKDTDIQFRAFMEYFMLDEKIEPMGYEMLNDNADEIFDDVDMIMTSLIHNFVLPKPIGHQHGTGILENHYLLQQFGSTYQIPPNVLSKLRKANNVIPYKSNTFDCVVKQIDSFSHFTCHKWKETPPELYKKDKNIILDYLDHQLNQPLEIAEFLAKNDIPYKYFDLDNDNYNEVFGGNFEVDKEYTSHAPTWVGYEDRYNEVVKIAEEYITLRNLAQPYIPPKL